MPSNRVMYIGVLLVAAAACIYVGAWLTKRIEWIVPYIFGLGALLLIAGMILEVRKRKSKPGPQPEAPKPASSESEV